MKSAIEDHDLELLVCRWWELAADGGAAAHNAIMWLYGAGATHPDEQTCYELLFLSHVMYERKMLP